LTVGEIAPVFGVLLLHPLKTMKSDPARVERLSELAVGFCARLIEDGETGQIYPMNPQYLPPEVLQRVGSAPGPGGTKIPRMAKPKVVSVPIVARSPD
jgi:hypothetical protein